MKSTGLAFFTDIHWTLIGLLIFFGLFLVILFLQLRAYPKTKINEIENLPFEGDNYELR